MCTCVCIRETLTVFSRKISFTYGVSTKWDGIWQLCVSVTEWRQEGTLDSPVGSFLFIVYILILVNPTEGLFLLCCVLSAFFSFSCCFFLSLQNKPRSGFLAANIFEYQSVFVLCNIIILWNILSFHLIKLWFLRKSFK